MAKMNVGMTSMQIQVLTQHHGKYECWHDFITKISVKVA